MRQLFLQVRRGHSSEAMSRAREHGGVNLVCVDGQDTDGRADLVLMYGLNAKVGNVIDALRISLASVPPSS